MNRKEKYASAIIPAVFTFSFTVSLFAQRLISLGQQLNSVSPILAWPTD